MKLEQQVCSLELAKKLKELGVKQESLFYWKFSNGMLEKVSNIEIETELVYGKQPAKPKYLGTWETCSAFTVAELGEMLPADLNVKRKGNFNLGLYKWLVGSFSIDYSQSDYEGCPQTLEVKGKQVFFDADTEADCRAKMLIYLLENKLITL